MSLRIVQLNLAYDAAAPSAAALLDRYPTLVEWSGALARTGATVHVVQRFSHDGLLTRDAATFAFVRDAEPPMLDAWRVSAAAIAATTAAAPDVVHVNGLMFPAMTQALRAALPGAAIVLQDHAGHRPDLGPWPLHLWRRRPWAQAFAAADAVTFTAAALAAPWHARGLPRELPVLEIIEASTRLRAMDQANSDAPRLLWVGRLVSGKDPLTALAAAERLMADRPARLDLIYGDAPLETVVRARVEASPILRDRVTFVGRVPHHDLPGHYARASVFLSASRHEGSGYALIEAMACGVTPVVTNIPPFKAIAGAYGQYFRAGRVDDCAAAIRRALATAPDTPATRAAIRARFADVLSWEAIAGHTRKVYDALWRQRRTRA